MVDIYVYDELKRNKFAFEKEADMIIKRLLQKPETYAELEQLVTSYGLNFETYASAEEVIAKIDLMIRDCHFEGASYTKQDLVNVTDLIKIKKQISEFNIYISSCQAKIYLLNVKVKHSSVSTVKEIDYFI